MISAIESHLTLPSPLHRIETSWTTQANIELYVKRDDLLHPIISGNKWRKLKAHLAWALAQDPSKSIVSFGGTFSNHLLALAEIGFLLSLPTIGIVRAHREDRTNPFLQHMRARGMRIILRPPKLFDKVQTLPLEALGHELELENAYCIPMGGTDQNALIGMKEVSHELPQGMSFDQLWLAVGSGGTIAGWSYILAPETKIIGVLPFKMSMEKWPGFEWADPAAIIECRRCYLNKRFGAFDLAISNFIESFHAETSIWLDPIYTARTMLNLKSAIEKNEVQRGARILFYHSGGLAGIDAYNYLNADSRIPFQLLNV